MTDVIDMEVLMLMTVKMFMNFLVYYSLWIRFWCDPITMGCDSAVSQWLEGFSRFEPLKKAQSHQNPVSCDPLLSPLGIQEPIKTSPRVVDRHLAARDLHWPSHLDIGHSKGDAAMLLWVSWIQNSNQLSHLISVSYHQRCLQGKTQKFSSMITTISA